eukprot:6422726-Amphidinium_carterae.2
MMAHYISLCLLQSRSMQRQDVDSKRRRVGRPSSSDLKAVALETYPPGPSTCEALGSWPDHVADGLASSGNDSELTHRLWRHFHEGLRVSTDYSGMDCCREGFRLTLAALIKKHKWHPSSLAPQPLRWDHVCDIAPLAQQVLLETTPADTCVFSDILHRLPQEAQSWISAASPSRSDAATAAAAEAYSEIKTWVDENAKWLYPDAATSYCLRHKCNCRVVKDSSGTDSTEMTQMSVMKDSSGTDSAEMSVMKDSSGTDSAEMKRPLVLNIAGVSCLPWTIVGKQEGFGSPCEVPHTVWVYERRERALCGQEDLVLVECTPRYPVPVTLGEPLQDSHHTVSIVTGPEQMGWPHRRTRKLAACISKKTCFWTGPVTDAEVAEDFRSRFNRGVVLAGSAFFMASEEDDLKRNRTVP